MASEGIVELPGWRGVPTASIRAGRTIPEIEPINVSTFFLLGRRRGRLALSSRSLRRRHGLRRGSALRRRAEGGYAAGGDGVDGDIDGNPERPLPLVDPAGV